MSALQITLTALIRAGSLPLLSLRAHLNSAKVRSSSIAIALPYALTYCVYTLSISTAFSTGLLILTAELQKL
jgi:hypothetical protein